MRIQCVGEDPVSVEGYVADIPGAVRVLPAPDTDMGQFTRYQNARLTRLYNDLKKSV